VVSQRRIEISMRIAQLEGPAVRNRPGHLQHEAAARDAPGQPLRAAGPGAAHAR
jgi:hypothetical protein